MAKQEIFRWRTNPNIIAQYILDKQVPAGSKVTLKPNEACAILEGGRVVGVVSQIEMEVNPKIGTLSKMFGKKNPSRAFLFAFLGPHEIMMKMTAKTVDNQAVNGIAFLRVNISREAVPRLLQLPAKGKTHVTIGDLSKRLELEASQKVASEIIASINLEELRSDPNIEKDIQATLKMSLRPTMESLGLTMEAAWTTWNDTESEKIISMQVDLENMVVRNEVMDAKDVADANRIFKTKVRQIELKKSLHLAEMDAEAKKLVAEEVATLTSQMELDQTRWDTMRAQEFRNIGHEQEKAILLREEQLAAASHELEMARHNIQQKSMEADSERMEKQKEFDIQVDQAETHRAIQHEQSETHRAIQNEQTQLELDRDHQEQIREEEIQERREQTKADRTMSTFKEVQDAKADRKAQEADREQQRLGVQSGMSDKIVDTLAQIATESGDSNVSLEALRTLSDLRKQDIEASSEAYVEEKGEDSEDESPKV
jgi:hypothetical protein